MKRVREAWLSFTRKHETSAQFIIFFLISNGVTALQLALMPIFRWMMSGTSLVETNFQVGAVGSQLDGSPYYMFDYAAGDLPHGGGGLAYFIAVQVTLLIAQVVNFFLQRNVTFRSNTSITVAAMWYFIAYVVITVIAAVAQGFYKAPIYQWLIGSLGQTGEVVADVLTMIINATISFWVFFPIFKVIFKRVPDEQNESPVGTGLSA